MSPSLKHHQPYIENPHYTTIAAADNKTMEASKATTVETTMAAVSGNKTHIEKSNHVNLRSIVRCTYATVATMDSNARAKM